MADELADIQSNESAGVVENSPIPETGEPVERSAAPEKPAKQERKSIREALTESIETVREAEAKKDKTGRLHHPADGKYVPKEKPVEAQAPAEIPKTEKDAQPKEPSTAAIGPPPGWSAESKAAYATLPDHIKNDLAKREKEVSDGFKQKSEVEKRYQAIDQVLAPSRAAFQQAGVPNDAEAIKGLLFWEQALRNPQTRMQAYQRLGQQYGINLNSPQSQAPDDPLRPVYDQFGQLTQQVSTIQGELQRSREEQVSRTLTDFAKDKPHFEKVRVEMGQLIQSGIVPPNDLDGAYQRAIWSNPETQKLLIKEQFDKQQAEALKNQTNRAQAARQAAISPSTRSPTAPVVNGSAKGGKQSVRDAIMAAKQQLEDQRA